MTENEFPEVVCLTVPASLDGVRADAAAAKLLDISRSAAERIITSGGVLCSGKEINKKTAVREGDVLEVTLPEAEPCEALPEDIPLDVVYEDGDVIVINKPSGMVVHPAPGHASGTLVSALLFHCAGSLSGIGGVTRPGIVHRIDKETSGLIAVAKNDAAHVSLASQLECHSMRRTYAAIVLGHPGDGTVDAPLARHPVDRKKMAVSNSPAAKRAVTHFVTEEEMGQFSLLRLELETGRTHQIRVHMAHVGHPVLGDPVYGGDRTTFQKHHPALFDGQMLHAHRLTLTHPTTGETMTFEAPLPENMTRAIEILRMQN